LVTAGHCDLPANPYTDVDIYFPDGAGGMKMTKSWWCYSPGTSFDKDWATCLLDRNEQFRGYFGYTWWNITSRSQASSFPWKNGNRVGYDGWLPGGARNTNTLLKADGTWSYTAGVEYPQTVSNNIDGTQGGSGGPVLMDGSVVGLSSNSLRQGDGTYEGQWCLQVPGTYCSHYTPTQFWQGQVNNLINWMKTNGWR
jgi:hypothetical protein